MVPKPNAHTILALLLKSLSDLCSSGREQRKSRTRVELRFVSFPSCSDVDKDECSFYWCVASVTLFDSLSDLWKSADSSYGLFTSRVLAIVG